MFLPHSAPRPAVAIPAHGGQTGAPKSGSAGEWEAKLSPKAGTLRTGGGRGLFPIPQARAPAGPPHRERHSQAKGAGGLRFSPTRSGGLHGPIKVCRGGLRGGLVSGLKDR